MEELYTPVYKDEGPFFLSNFGQITRCVRIHGVHNEEAIDRNTEAIIEQTEMQHSESDESQIQFSGHSMMLERESNESQKLFKDELNETQDILTAHTQAMKDEAAATRTTMAEQGTGIKNAIEGQGTGIKNALTSKTQSLNAELESVVSKLEGIAGKIQANTDVDNTRLDAIQRAIANLQLVVNNQIVTP